MKKILSTLFLSSSFLALSACSTGTVSTKTTEPTDKNIVATINGKAITENAVKTLKTETAMYNKRIKVSREQLINELINRELLYQQAIKHQLDQKPEILDRIETAKRSILFQSEMMDYLNKVVIADAELQAEYESQSAKIAPDLVEYKASHILTKTKKEAKDIIRLLKKGKKFSALAKQFSTDPSASKGGELGWFDGKQMVPEFSATIILLKNGSYTQEPVKTGHGWHIILREDSRQKPVPALEKVAEALKTRMKRIKLQGYMKDLKENAKIIISSESASEKK